LDAAGAVATRSGWAGGAGSTLSEGAGPTAFRGVGTTACGGVGSTASGGLDTVGAGLGIVSGVVAIAIDAG
jgi:hypothetical protein